MAKVAFRRIVPAVGALTVSVPGRERSSLVRWLPIVGGAICILWVVGELVVAPPTDISQRSNDTYITSKVKARFVEANKFPPNAVKVVTERGVVYLMGIVTKAESTALAANARGQE